jgi:TolA-binding protein
MTPWLALSVGLVLGQTPASTPSQSKAAQEAQQLRARLQALEAQQQQDAANTQQLQQQLSGMQERASELERLRQQRVAELERARNWLVAADQALAVGELGINDTLLQADLALAQVQQSASASGSGHTIVLVEDARRLIAQAFDDTSHRDTLQARGRLFDADWLLQEARRDNLNTSGATLVSQ